MQFQFTKNCSTTSRNLNQSRRYQSIGFQNGHEFFNLQQAQSRTWHAQWKQTIIQICHRFSQRSYKLHFFLLNYFFRLLMKCILSSRQVQKIIKKKLLHERKFIHTFLCNSRHCLISFSSFENCRLYRIYFNRLT